MKLIYVSLGPWVAMLLVIGLLLGGLLSGSWALALLVLSLLFGCLFFVYSLLVWLKRRESGALIAMGPGLLSVLGVIAFVSLTLSFPPINDISTDLENPPEFFVLLQEEANLDRDMSFPAENRPVIRRSYPRLSSLILEANMDEVLDAIDLMMTENPQWELVGASENGEIIEIVATTPVFGFQDDVVIRLTPQERSQVKVDIRSKSRVGRGDFGKNMQRILIMFDLLESHFAS